mgnify:CR=1 FL=1
MVDSILLDLSGVLYDGEAVIPGAVHAVAQAQQSGLRVRFVSNTSQKSRESLLVQLRKLGFIIEREQLFTALDAARQWLQQRKLRPYCLVHAQVSGEFSDLDQHDPNAVLIADAAEGFNYANLNAALAICMEGAPLLGVGYNRYYRADGEWKLDAGAFIRALEFAAGVEATIVGKPSAEFFQQVVDSFDGSAGRALMVGDDVFGDVEGALNAGLQACLVRTGKYRSGDEDRIDGDFHVVDSIVDAVTLALT